MAFKLKTSYQNGVPLKKVTKASGTVIPANSMVTLSSGLAILAQANSASLMFCPYGAPAGVTELLVVDDTNAEFTANADANFAVANRGTEVDLVVAAASLTTGVAEDDYAVWELIENGSFRINIDGTDYNIDGIDFDTSADMDAVAAVIQAAIRAETSGSETVTFNATDDIFVITSGSTIAGSYVGPITTSTGTVGTDISTAALLNGGANAATLTQLEQKVDLGSSSTDVLKVDTGVNAGTVDSPLNVTVKVNKFAY